MGQHLNPANMIVLPLILGIGVDNGVHAFHDYRRQRGRYQMSSSVINAMMLNSLTSMIGFGSMLIADHRGLASLGLVLTIGVGSCLLVSLVPLPALLTLVSRRGSRTTAAITMPTAAMVPSQSESTGTLGDADASPVSQDDGMRLPKAG
jgi:hypothetical protein